MHDVMLLFHFVRKKRSLAQKLTKDKNFKKQTRDGGETDICMNPVKFIQVYTSLINFQHMYIVD